jgi:pilus assembly protein CpaB
MKRRGLTIALAVLLAILGTAGVLVYVNHANARALAGQRAVTVLIAKSLIPSGTSAGDAQDQGLLGTEKLPAASVPTDALTAVTPDISSLVTDANVQPGQLLLRPMLVTSAQVTTGFAIPSGMVAVAIQFCVPEAVAGNLLPGSLVAVFATTIKSNSSSSSSNSSNSSLSAQAACSGPHQFTTGFTATTKLVLPKVKVLAVGPASANGQGNSQSSGSGSSGSASSSALITVAVSQQDAARLIQLTEGGLPYLALLNGNSALTGTTTGASSKGH